MINIKGRIFVISMVMLALLMNLVYASNSRLIFSDVDVKVGGRTSNNLRDGDRIDEQAKPGDALEFRVKVQNNFTSEENLKIKDITVKVTIQNIDDGGDLEEESKSFDLSPGSDKRVTLKFETPLEVDEDTFDVLIHAEGEDKNSTNHESDMKIRLEVNKETHALKITKASLSPAVVSCNRKSIQLSTSLINIGTDDENDVTFKVSNPELDIDLKDNINELRAQPNEPESRFSKTYSFKINDDTTTGSYPITLTALYDNDRKRKEETATLTVNDCLTITQKTKKTEEDLQKNIKEQKEEVTVTTSAPTIEKSTSTVVQPTTQSPDTIITQESFYKSDAFIIGIIIAELAAVVVGIILIVTLFRRKV